MNKGDSWNEKFKKEDIWEFKTTPWQRVRFNDVLMLLPKEVDSVLELGCMEGEFTRLMPYPAEKIVALDISTVALERAKKKLTGVKFEAWDIEEKPYPATFDLIICMETLYYFDNQKTAKENILTMLKDGGVLVLEHVLNSIHDNRVIADYFHPFYWEDVRFGKEVFFERYGKSGSESYQILVMRKK